MGQHVGSLRAATGGDLDDPRLTEFIGELSVRSDAFRTLWTRHDVRPKGGGVKRFAHPLAGELVLDYESFAVVDADRQLLVAYHAAPDSDAEQALAYISGMTGADGAALERRERLGPPPALS